LHREKNKAQIYNNLIITLGPCYDFYFKIHP
jgi:hypothetical protein